MVDLKHVVTVEFTDDHSIDGMSITLRGVTPLQIHAAIWYMTRAANRLADMQELATESEKATSKADAIEIARDLTDSRIRRIGGTN